MSSNAPLPLPVDLPRTTDPTRVRRVLDEEAHRRARLIALRLVQMLSRLCGPPR